MVIVSHTQALWNLKLLWLNKWMSKMDWYRQTYQQQAIMYATCVGTTSTSMERRHLVPEQHIPHMALLYKKFIHTNMCLGLLTVDLGKERGLCCIHRQTYNLASVKSVLSQVCLLHTAMTSHQFQINYLIYTVCQQIHFGSSVEVYSTTSGQFLRGVAGCRKRENWNMIQFNLKLAIWRQSYIPLLTTQLFNSASLLQWRSHKNCNRITHL